MIFIHLNSNNHNKKNVYRTNNFIWSDDDDDDTKARFSILYTKILYSVRIMQNIILHYRMRAYIHVSKILHLHTINPYPRAHHQIIKFVRKVKVKTYFCWCNEYIYFK